MTNAKRKQRGNVCTVGVKGMVAVQKGMSHRCYRGKTGRVYSVVNKQVKGKILAKGSNERVEHIRHSKSQGASWNMWRKVIKERRTPKRKVLGFNWSASLPHPEQLTLWERVERSPSCWNPFPVNSWHDSCEEKNNNDEKKKTSNLKRKKNQVPHLLN